MAKKYFLVLLIVAFGLMAVGCTDPRLNGRWVSGGDEMIFRNGDFELWRGDRRLGGGTFTTRDGTVTLYFSNERQALSYSISGDTLTLGNTIFVRNRR